MAVVLTLTAGLRARALAAARYPASAPAPVITPPAPAPASVLVPASTARPSVLAIRTLLTPASAPAMVRN
jgi:hypothetical protein